MTRSSGTWGKLSEDDLAAIAGQRDRLAGLLQERYGYEKVVAENKVDQFALGLNPQSVASHAVGSNHSRIVTSQRNTSMSPVSPRAMAAATERIGLLHTEAAKVFLGAGRAIDAFQFPRRARVKENDTFLKCFLKAYRASSATSHPPQAKWRQSGSKEKAPIAFPARPVRITVAGRVAAQWTAAWPTK